MKYSALRSTQFTRRWPVGPAWKLDYPVGHVWAHRLARRAAGYFYLNRGWRRSRNLFSHVRCGWSPQGWAIRVFYVDRRRPRPRRRRRLSGRLGWVRRTGRRPYLAGVARRWGCQRPARWIWCRLPGLFAGNLETLMAHLVYRFRGRAERRIKSVALPLLKLAQKLPGVVGARVRCHGRFTRRQRADHATYRWGTLRRTNMGARVADAAVTVALRFGAVGVTVLISYAR